MMISPTEDSVQVETQAKILCVFMMLIFSVTSNCTYGLF